MGARTSLVGSDVDGYMLGRVGALAGDAVHSLNLEGVQRVRPQAADEDPRLREAQLPRDKLHAVVARRARAPVRSTLPAHYVVDHILAAARLPWRVPFQRHRRLINDRDDVAGARRDTCAHNHKSLGSRTLCSFIRVLNPTTTLLLIIPENSLCGHRGHSSWRACFALTHTR